MRQRALRLTAISHGRMLASAPPLVILPILDSLTAQPTMACSIRKLRSAYAGACVRVRRSSDNAESDIGFAASGILDEAALLAHVGSGDGFVTTWYDQIGANNLIQPTSANQPRVVTAGVVEKLATSGVPSINLIASSSTHFYTAASFLEYRFSFASAFSEGAATGAATQILNRTNGQLGSLYLTSTSRLACRLGDATSVVTATAAIPAFTAGVSTGYASNEKRSLLLNSQASLLNTVLQTVAADLRQLYVGIIPPTSSPFNGRLGEVIITNNVDITTNGDQSILHGNMMTTWGAV